MILLPRSIHEKNILSPFVSEKYRFNGVSGGPSYIGYDVCLGADVSVNPGSYALAVTREHFTMPNDVAAFVHDKSTWARKGIFVQNTVIEPGWKGWLTIEISNASNTVHNLVMGTPIAQIIFHQLPEAVDGYEGKYQNQPPVPTPAIFE